LYSQKDAQFDAFSIALLGEAKKIPWRAQKQSIPISRLFFASGSRRHSTSFTEILLKCIAMHPLTLFNTSSASASKKMHLFYLHALDLLSTLSQRGRRIRMADEMKCTLDIATVF